MEKYASSARPGYRDFEYLEYIQRVQRSRESRLTTIPDHYRREISPGRIIEKINARKSSKSPNRLDLGLIGPKNPLREGTVAGDKNFQVYSFREGKTERADWNGTVAHKEVNSLSDRPLNKDNPLEEISKGKSIIHDEPHKRVESITEYGKAQSQQDNSAQEEIRKLKELVQKLQEENLMLKHQLKEVEEESARKSEIIRVLEEEKKQSIKIIAGLETESLKAQK